MIFGIPTPEVRAGEATVALGELESSETNLSDFLVGLAKQEGLLWIRHNGGESQPVWAEDIRADYKNRELYLPVMVWDTIEDPDRPGEEIGYNYRLEKHVFHSYKDGWVAPEVEIQPSELINYRYKVDLSKLRFSMVENEGADKWLVRYAASSYGYQRGEVDTGKYKKISRTYIGTRRREVLKKLKLKFYGPWLNMNYKRVRDWTLRDLQKAGFSDEDLQIGVNYGARRLGFELELYTKLWDQRVSQEFECKSVRKRDGAYEKIFKGRKNGIYLVLEHNLFI